MRVVLDTNVVVQGAISPHGAAGVLMGLALIHSVDVLADERILEECDDVLSRKEFRFARRDIVRLLDRIRRAAEMVVPLPWPGGRKGFPDPDDVKFLEVAASGRADVLISRNVKHFPKAKRGDVVVVQPLDFVQQYLSVG